MRGRQRALAALLVCILHLAVFAPRVGEWSSVLVNDFAPQAEAIESGDRPYGDQDLEYPPFSLVPLQVPALFSEDTDGFVEAFQWEMLVFDVAIVLLLALALPGRPREVISALGVYTCGVVLLSGVILDDSAIDQAPLALSRFDLVPAFLILAAVLARDAARSATWSALLSVATMVKAFPLLLYPALLRREVDRGRVALAAAIPIFAAAIVVLAWGDTFFSAITYHTERELQIESVPSTPFEVASLLGAGATPAPGHGGFDLVASGAGVAKWVWILLGLGIYLTLVRAGWRSRISNLRLVTALLAVLIVFATVLSPQFLLWLLPLSAAAYGLGRENVVLLVAVILTQVMLQNYGEALEGEFGAAFVWPLAARNVTLLVYLWLVCVPILQSSSETGDAGLRDPARPELPWQASSTRPTRTA
ncbi:MAG TPA: glycosyltransferase 87 family protein [Solirubrobacterales bacterium]|nr:glycosyltransferase 87 family protein [Solirubrobacterales bacterium]